MDPPTPTDKIVGEMDIDLMPNDLGLYGNRFTVTNCHYFSNGLLQDWPDTPFDELIPEATLQDDTNFSIFHQTYQFDDAPITPTDPFFFPNPLNEATEQLDAADFLTTYYSTSTESTTLSLDYLSSGGPSSTESRATSVCDVPFDELDVSYFLQNTPGSVTSTDLQPSPQLRNGSFGQMTKVPKKALSRPCDIKKERRKIERPDACQFCTAKFAHNRDLQRHLGTRQHEKEVRNMKGVVKRFKCEHPSCSKTFSRRDHRTRHLKRFHPGK